MRVEKPSRLRPIRLAVRSVYIALALFVATCISISAFSGARNRMGVEPEPAPLSSVDAAAQRTCLKDLEGLYGELTERLGATLESQQARRSSVEFEDWSPLWRQRMLEVGARCRLGLGDAPGSQVLKEAFEHMLELHRHYTTLAVQFSKEIGPFAEHTRLAMERAQGAGGSR